MLHDLTWFFDDAVGDLGVRAIPVEPSTRGTGTAPMGPGDAEMAASKRWRTIAGALHRLPHDQQAILKAAHLPLLPSLRAQLRGVFGDLAGVVLLLVGLKRATMLARPSEAVAARDVKELAERHLAAASAAYAAHAKELMEACRLTRRSAFEMRLRGAA